MVRNTTGGNNNKQFARKHMSDNSKTGLKLRVSEDQGELYAIATKMLGNNMFHAIALDGLQYLVHIRGKFSGRGRRDNTIGLGTWVLIGLRSWSNKNQDKNQDKIVKVKIQEADILEVYSELDKARLQETVDEDWDILDDNDPTKIDKEDKKIKSEINWQTEKEVEKERLEEEIHLGTTAKIALNDTASQKVDMVVYVEDI
jgi:translation initiation factor IF-1